MEYPIHIQGAILKRHNNGSIIIDSTETRCFVGLGEEKIEDVSISHSGNLFTIQCKLTEYSGILLNKRLYDDMIEDHIVPEEKILKHFLYIIPRPRSWWGVDSGWYEKKKKRDFEMRTTHLTIL